MLQVIDQSRLRKDINLHDMYREMVWTADGYMHMEMRKDNVDVDKIKLDFERLISMWEKVYKAD